ncbi:Uncharacterised protein [Mycoplasmopsis columbinasalis]|uniref:Lipoprotein n=2 Tax=Mycoplasmopsis columbinasalis TaxID=114880 RepID=A0A449B9Q5_9BACT|nr:Uncharacterised protein [Mycoplasmopsis columbinasalis]
MKKKLKWTLFSAPLTLISALPLLAVSCGKSNENTNTLNNNETNATENETENNHTGTLDTNNVEINNDKNVISSADAQYEKQNTTKVEVQTKENNVQNITINKTFELYKPYTFYWMIPYWSFFSDDSSFDETFRNSRFDYIEFGSKLIQETYGDNELDPKFTSKELLDIVYENEKNKLKRKDLDIPAFEVWKKDNIKNELVNNWKSNFLKIFNPKWFFFEIKDLHSEDNKVTEEDYDSLKKETNSFKQITEKFSTELFNILSPEDLKLYIKENNIIWKGNRYNFLSEIIERYLFLWKEINETTKLYSYYNFPYKIYNSTTTTYEMMNWFELKKIETLRDKKTIKFEFILNKEYEKEKEISHSILNMLPVTKFYWYLDTKTKAWMFSENDFNELGNTEEYLEKNDEYWWKVYADYLDVGYSGSFKPEEIKKYTKKELISKFYIENKAKKIKVLKVEKKYAFLEKFLSEKFNVMLNEWESRPIIHNVNYNEETNTFEIFYNIKNVELNLVLNIKDAL